MDHNRDRYRTARECGGCPSSESGRQNRPRTPSGVLSVPSEIGGSIAGHLNEHNRLGDESTSFRILTGMFALEVVIKVVVGVDFSRPDSSTRPTRRRLSTERRTHVYAVACSVQDVALSRT